MKRCCPPRVRLLSRVLLAALLVAGGPMARGAHASGLAPGAQDAPGFPGIVRVPERVGAEEEFSLPYRLVPPPVWDAGTRYPVVLFLHGAGERGSDNLAQLEHLPAVPGAFLLAPQCPEGRRWVEAPWGDVESKPMAREASAPLRAALQALEDLLRSRHPVDRDRVAVTGLSMGGYGAWEIACRRPDLFVAAAPICGGGDEGSAHRLVGLPIWAWHGAEDRAVPPIRSERMVEAVRDAGGEARWTELAGVGHDAWVAAYGEGGVLPWLLAQRRPAGLRRVALRGGTTVVPGGGALELLHGGTLEFVQVEGAEDIELAQDVRFGGDGCVLNLNGPDVLLRLHGDLSCAGRLVLEGPGGGGVRLGADNRRTLTGEVVLRSGRLVLGHPGALGDATPTELRGGVLELAGGRHLEEPLVVTGAAAVLGQAGARLSGEVLVRAGATLSLAAEGEALELAGRLWGSGDLTWDGGALRLSGAEPNALGGRWTLRAGTVVLAQRAGRDAISGSFVLGGGAAPLDVVLAEAHQVADGAAWSVLGPGPVTLATDGRDERLGPLTLIGDLVLDLGRIPGETGASEEPGRGGGAVTLADCRGAVWAGTLEVRGWSDGTGGSPEASPASSLTIEGLTDEQLARIRFVDPAGRSPGTYGARRGPGGTLVPEE